MPVHVVAATASDVPELVDVAARSFALACSPSTPDSAIAVHLAEHLSVERFLDHLADPDRVLLVARDDRDTSMAGYAMIVRGVPADPDIQRAVTVRPAAELSKIYVLAGHHGGAVAPALMAACLEAARLLGAASVWLGTNRDNVRAQRFYAKHGFAVTGTREFRLGPTVEQDLVLARPL